MLSQKPKFLGNDEDSESNEAEQ